MRDEPLLVLNGAQVAGLLEGRERRLMDVVEAAYRAHADGLASLPHSTFLTFPHSSADRIIALPAYLGGPRPVAGVKWISSFPGNIDSGLERASAVIVLNSLATGRPVALLEGSLISARRTAASAALAAERLHGRRDGVVLGQVGCGRINHEVLRFLGAADLRIDRVLVTDLRPARAVDFVRQARLQGWPAEAVGDVDSVLARCDLVSFATTAGTPHVDRLPCQPGTTILHVSLRDLAPEVIVSCDNVVDDADHVCRARTSVHLAAQSTGTRRFIRCSLGEVLLGRHAPRRGGEDVLVFSPFGLGILDVAVAAFIEREARRTGVGHELASFWPPEWTAAPWPRGEEQASA